MGAVMDKLRWYCMIVLIAAINMTVLLHLVVCFL